MTDTQLLQTYVGSASQDAFARLVERYINLVYSVALRNTRDREMAEDVTQAVFIVLAKQARSVRDPALLPAWLMSTTRYTANNARRQECRRRRHEQKAAAMKTESHIGVEYQSDLMPLLDDGMSALGPADRTAVILRYLHGKTAREIGENLGVSEASAQKRITRALEKIRTFFSRRGVVCPADAIEVSLCKDYLHTAPAALAPVIITRAMSTAAGTTSVSILVEGTLKTIAWAQAKLVAFGCAACLLVVAGGVVVVAKSPVLAEAGGASRTATSGPAASIAAATTSIAAVPASQPTINVLLLPNDSFTEKSKNSRYIANIDEGTRRNGGPPALMLRSPTTNPTTTSWVSRRADLTPFLGKRVRFSAYIKSADVSNWGGLLFYTYDKDGRTRASDDMVGRGVTSAADWSKLEIVSDIAADATGIGLGLHLKGSGALWLDDARLEVVGNEVPTTDDHNGHLYTAVASNYSAFVDELTQHNGHAVVCISSAKHPTGSWCWYGSNHRTPEEYLGKRVRVTAWIKAEKVTGSTRLSIWAWTPDGKLVCLDNTATRKIIKGTKDWAKYETTADVPAALQHLDPGLNLFGNGKVWVDDMRFEVAPDDSSL